MEKKVSENLLKVFKVSTGTTSADRTKLVQSREPKRQCLDRQFAIYLEHSMADCFFIKCGLKEFEAPPVEDDLLFEQFY